MFQNDTAHHTARGLWGYYFPTFHFTKTILPLKQFLRKPRISQPNSITALATVAEHPCPNNLSINLGSLTRRTSVADLSDLNITSTINLDVPHVVHVNAAVEANLVGVKVLAVALQDLPAREEVVADAAGDPGGPDLQTSGS